MKFSALAALSLMVTSAAAHATPDASDDARQAMTEALAAVGSAKAAASAVPVSPAPNVKSSDRGQSAGCDAAAGAEASWLPLAAFAVALRTLGRRRAGSGSPN